VVTGRIPVDIRQTAVVRVAAIEAMAAALKNYLFPPDITED